VIKTVTKPTNVNMAVVIIERCESRERARTPCPLEQPEPLTDKEIDRQMYNNYCESLLPVIFRDWMSKR